MSSFTGQGKKYLIEAQEITTSEILIFDAENNFKLLNSIRSNYPIVGLQIMTIESIPYILRSFDGSIDFFELSSGNYKFSLESLGNPDNDPKRLHLAKDSNGEDVLLSTNNAYYLSVWDIQNKSVKRKIELPQNYKSPFLNSYFSEELQATILYLQSDDGEISFINLENREIIQTIQNFPIRRVKAFVFIKIKGRDSLILSTDEGTRVIDLISWTMTNFESFERDWPVFFSELKNGDNSYLLISFSTGNIAVYDLENSIYIAKYNSGQEWNTSYATTYVIANDRKFIVQGRKGISQVFEISFN